MATAMITSTPAKTKKKTSSPSKQNRSTAPGTLKRNPKYELKKDELIQLLGRFEGELQAKDIALAALKSEKVKTLLSNARFGRLNCQTDPYSSLLRDCEYIKDDTLNEQMPIKNAYETQLVQLEELILQQRKQVQTLKLALDDTEQRFASLTQELENEKKENRRLQTFQNQLILVQEEKCQLRNEIENMKIHKQELEKHLIQMTQLLEYEHERHKKFVVLILNQHKQETEYYKQLTTNHVNDDSQREAKFKELELENERNKQVLIARINQLQSEIDLLVKQKTNHVSSPDGEVAEINSKHQSKSRQLPSTNEPTPPVNNEKSTSVGIRRPTVIPTSSKNGSTSTTKSNVAPPPPPPPSIPARTQQSSVMTNSTSSISDNPVSPVPTVAKRNIIPTRSIGTVSPSSIGFNSRSSPNNNQTSTMPINSSSTNPTRGGIPRLTKIVKPTTTSSTTAPAKRPGQTSISSEHKIDDLRSLLETIYSVAENRLTSPTDIADPIFYTDKTEPNSSTISSHPNFILFRAAEKGDTEQLIQLLKHGSNPNSQMFDGNTCLHLSTSNGHIECIRYLLKYDANPFIENNLGLTSWNNLLNLNEILQLECLQLFVDISQRLPPVDLIYSAIEFNHTNIYGYLLSILHEEFKSNSSHLSRLLKLALRSSNTHFLECLFTIVSIQDFVQLVDPYTFISNECLEILSILDNKQDQLKPINLIVRLVSSPGERRYSYAIGTITLTSELSWLELERSCVKIFIDHITQIDSPFDYVKSSIGCTANHIETITLGSTKWHYQDSPNDRSPMPYTTVRERDSIMIQLKGMNMNATESLAYNYLIPSQNLKNFLRYIEQNSFVGVYGAAHLQKKSLFEDLIRYFERSTSSKLKIIRFEFESVTSLDDFIDELVHQDFFRTCPWSKEQQTIKYLLFFSNIQNSIGTDVLNLLFNSELIGDACQKLNYSREDEPRSIITYYFPSIFRVFLTMSKRTWSTENEIYKKFKWIPFKIDSVPWNGLLKRHLWRRMIDINLTENRSIDNELIKTLQWITNVWQRYNECLQKLSLQDALLGPALFFDCPMECQAIFDWLQMKWNRIVAPLVRELSMNKCAQPKSKSSTSATAAATAIASTLRANSLEISTPYESVACTALYVLLHRAVSRDCPLTGQEREQYLLNFVGSRLEGGGSSSMMSSAASSRASTPQPSNSCDFISIQLE